MGEERSHTYHDSIRIFMEGCVQPISCSSMALCTGPELCVNLYALRKPATSSTTAEVISNTEALRFVFARGVVIYSDSNPAYQQLQTRLPLTQPNFQHGGYLPTRARSVSEFFFRGFLRTRVWLGLS